MSCTNEPARLYAQGLAELQVSELLFAEAAGKQLRGERIEAIELRDEALARQLKGLALLDQAVATYRRIAVEDGQRSDKYTHNLQRAVSG